MFILYFCKKSDCCDICKVCMWKVDESQTWVNVEVLCRYMFRGWSHYVKQLKPLTCSWDHLFLAVYMTFAFFCLNIAVGKYLLSYVVEVQPQTLRVWIIIHAEYSWSIIPMKFSHAKVWCIVPDARPQNNCHKKPLLSVVVHIRNVTVLC